MLELYLQGPLARTGRKGGLPEEGEVVPPSTRRGCPLSIPRFVPLGLRVWSDGLRRELSSSATCLTLSEADFLTFRGYIRSVLEGHSAHMRVRAGPLAHAGSVLQCHFPGG